MVAHNAYEVIRRVLAAEGKKGKAARQLGRFFIAVVWPVGMSKTDSRSFRGNVFASTASEANTSLRLFRKNPMETVGSLQLKTITPRNMDTHYVPLSCSVDGKDLYVMVVNRDFIKAVFRDFPGYILSARKIWDSFTIGGANNPLSHTMDEVSHRTLDTMDFLIPISYVEEGVINSGNRIRQQ